MEPHPSDYSGYTSDGRYRDDMDRYHREQEDTARRQAEDSQRQQSSSRNSSSDSSSCFVATAAYGDPAHPDVVYLRAFRDGVLNHNLLGRTFVSFYYKYGPAWADFVIKFQLRYFAKSCLMKLVNFIKLGYKPES